MRQVQGFTLIELALVAFIISVLAAVAIPAYTDYLIRASVTEGIQLARPVQKNIADYYAWHGALPANNHVAGVLPAGQLQGSYVASIKVEQGTVVITYGNHSAPELHGEVLKIIPQLPDSSFLSLDWHCAGNDSAISVAYLPTACKRSL